MAGSVDWSQKQDHTVGSRQRASSLGIYIGNLPNTITEDELYDLISEFKGVSVRKLIKKEGGKTFGFLDCSSEKTVLDVTKSLNRREVGGRKVVARPLDNRPPPMAETQKSENETVPDHTANKRFETPVSSGSQSTPETDDSDLAGVLHVSNFPYGTDEEELFTLFEDFEPLEICIVNNEPAGGLVTRAYIAVPESHVLDAVMNLDNTMYRRRLLLVNDVREGRMISELLDLDKMFSIRHRRKQRVAQHGRKERII